MNKKIITLPIALVALGCMVGCNGNIADEAAKLQKSDYFYDFSNAEYDKLFDFKSKTGLTAMDTDIAQFNLVTSLSNVGKAKQLERYRYRGRTSSDTQEKEIGEFVDANTHNKLQELEKIAARANTEEEFYFEAGIRDQVIGTITGEFTRPSGSVTRSNNKITKIYETTDKLKMYDNHVLNKYNSTKESEIYNDKYTVNGVDEIYDTTVFAQDRDVTGGKKTGIYYKTDANYYGIKPGLYDDVYKEVDYVEGQKDTFDNLIEDNFKYNKEYYAVDEILQYLNGGESKIGSVSALCDDNHIYIYSSGSNLLADKKGEAVLADLSELKYRTLDVVTNWTKDSYTMGGSMVIESYNGFLMNKAKMYDDYGSPAMRDAYLTASTTLKNAYSMLRESGINFIENPSKLVTSEAEFEKIGLDISKIFDYLLPIYSCNELVCTLTKIDNSWHLSNFATKNSSKLLKNEKGVILENPISYNANYNVVSLDYSDTGSMSVSYDSSKQLNEPFAVGTVQYLNNLTEANVERLATNETNDSSSIKVDEKYGYYTEDIYCSCDFGYKPGGIGIYDTTIYDSKVRDLPEGVHVYRGYISTSSNPFGIRVYDYGTKGAEPTTKVNSYGIFNVTKILDSMGKEVDTKKYIYSTDFKEIEGEWNITNPRIYCSDYIYVTLYLDDEGNIYNNESDDYGFVFELSTSVATRAPQQEGDQ